MIPPLIVREALERGIDLIAITDHNATANIASVQKAAQGSDLVVLPGMEIQTIEEVHSLCLFDTLEQAELFQTYVDQALPNIENDTDFFGEQFVVDETGEFIRREDRLLHNSVKMSLKQAWKIVKDLDGLFIPAHVNRKANGLFENLGFIPQDISIEALEISSHLTHQQAVEKFPDLAHYPLIQSGDVHYLSDFIGANYFQILNPTIAELRMAIRNESGRTFRSYIS